MLNTYKSLCTEYYHLDKPLPPENAFAFYLQFARQANGPIFEPMCGTGRFLIPFLEMGLEIYGLDASAQMLNICRQRCAEKKLKTVLYEQLLTQLNIEQKFNLIFIPSGSFGLFTQESDIKQVLQVLYRHLNSGGKLIFEIETLHARPQMEGIWSGSWVERPDGGKILLSTLSHFNEKQKVLNTICRYELLQENRIEMTEIEDFKVRLYEHHELDIYLEAAGFKKIVRMKAFSRTSPTEEDDCIVYACERI
jgi:ubiquinone/menaquinone biosynthesis C-methylase UbiE